MRRSKTSTFYFQTDCLTVWNAVTSGETSSAFSPVTDEEYDKIKNQSTPKSTAIARVTDLTPGKSCAYELHAGKFDIHWSAVFEPVEHENCCKMIMTETYQFEKGAVIPYILSLLFIRLRKQHRSYKQDLNKKLSSRQCM